MGPIENGNWGASGRGFQLFQGVYRPLGFGRYPIGVGMYLGGAAPPGLLNYRAPWAGGGGVPDRDHIPEL